MGQRGLLGATVPDVADIRRHPSTDQAMRWFDAAHLKGRQRRISEACGDLARQMLTELNDDPETTAGLRKLLEAKDCFVRSSLTMDHAGPPPDGARF